MSNGTDARSTDKRDVYLPPAAPLGMAEQTIERRRLRIGFRLLPLLVWR